MMTVTELVPHAHELRDRVQKHGKNAFQSLPMSGPQGNLAEVTPSVLQQRPMGASRVSSVGVPIARVCSGVKTSGSRLSCRRINNGQYIVGAVLFPSRITRFVETHTLLPWRPLCQKMAPSLETP